VCGNNWGCDGASYAEAGKLLGRAVAGVIHMGHRLTGARDLLGGRRGLDLARVPLVVTASLTAAS
jgi:hypothetical protein